MKVRVRVCVGGCVCVGVCVCVWGGGGEEDLITFFSWKGGLSDRETLFEARRGGGGVNRGLKVNGYFTWALKPIIAFYTSQVGMKDIFISLIMSPDVNCPTLGLAFTVIEKNAKNDLDLS